jgi:hypothetical protein
LYYQEATVKTQHTYKYFKHMLDIRAPQTVILTHQSVYSSLTFIATDGRVTVFLKCAVYIHDIGGITEFTRVVQETVRIIDTWHGAKIKTSGER